MNINEENFVRTRLAPPLSEEVGSGHVTCNFLWFIKNLHRAPNSMQMYGETLARRFELFFDLILTAIPSIESSCNADSVNVIYPIHPMGR